MENVARFLFKGVFFVYAAQFLRPSLWQHSRVFGANPDVVSFNIQNPIPHKSQKTKVSLEANRTKEVQTGTAGAKESGKEGARVPAEGSDTYLGARCRAFESPHSDHRKMVVFMRKRRFFFNYSHTFEKRNLLDHNFIQKYKGSSERLIHLELPIFLRFNRCFLLLFFVLFTSAISTWGKRYTP